MKTFAILGVALALAAATPTFAQDAGEREYMNNCASCHGTSGKGDGPLAEFLTIAVPDLTGIAARNDGLFPMLRTIQVIDGRSGVRGHGGPMPIWGQRFKDSMGAVGSYGTEIEVRGRILSLAYYLESIQAM